MNAQCIACHTAFPTLNDFGRLFKLSGYTQSAEQTNLPPVAIMLEPSYTHTKADQAGGAAPGFGDNNNFAFNESSIFYSGRLFGPYASHVFGPSAASFLNKFGVFSQVTYVGAEKAWSWDNVEFRFADDASVSGHDALWGIYLNNNPTLQDPWNTAPAWSFPLSGSELAPAPEVGPIIDGGVGQQVGGLGAYAMIDSKFYVDVAAYRTLSTRFQRAMGVDPTDEAQITGLAPYARVAYTNSVPDGSNEVGAFFMSSRIYPGRDASAGSDRMTDIGVDSEIQRNIGSNDITGLVSYIHEDQSLDASQALGNSTNDSAKLDQFKLSVNELLDKTYGFTVGYFNTSGSMDTGLYADSPAAKPDSDGLIFQFDYLPLNKTQGPDFWPRANVKFSVQYTAYNKFDGTSSNVDGTGMSARDNNTLYVQSWIAF